MTISQNTVDLLNPADFFRANYIRQIRQTISAYSTSMIVIGESLQNSIDAIGESAGLKQGTIDAMIDFDSHLVSIADNGIGFPPRVELLFLGGGDKDAKPAKGKVGVGIKVTLFSSSYFHLKSRNLERAWTIEIADGYQFEALESLQIVEPLPDDPDPLEYRGTELMYSFPSEPDGKSLLDAFVREVLDVSVPRGQDSGFWRSVTELNTAFPSPFAALLTSYLRRFTYVGDVRGALGFSGVYPPEGLNINFTIKCSQPIERFGEKIGMLFGQSETQTFSVSPSYMLVTDTLKWVPKGKKAPKIFNEKLGNGGKNIERTDGFNVLTLTERDQFEALLVDARGQSSPDIATYRERLFPHLNGIILTIGRIPDFDQYLPGASQRLISCNGVITSHEIDLTRGRNQEYVRCFDLILDVKGELNYGKTQLTNMHLVKIAKDYINDAYSRVIQNAAASWVGRLPQPGPEDPEIFVGRVDLGLDGYASRKVPRDENDVIALFFEMVGKGMFPDYRIFGLSQRDTYDGRAAIRRPSDDESKLNPKDDTQLRTIEFKIFASDLVRDFERVQKFAREVDLLIAWGEGNYDSIYYPLYDIQYSELAKQSPPRVFPRVSKYIVDSKEGSEIQVILLQQIVAELIAQQNPPT